MKINRILGMSFLAAVLLTGAGLTGCARKTAVVFEEELSGSASKDTEAPETAPAETPARQERPQEISPTPEPPQIFVDVCGAVRNPGVIELAAGSRVFEAVEAVGGMLPEAAAGYVNQAQLLTDGQQVYIPTKEEAEKAPRSENAGSTAAEGTDKVNLNTADEAALGNLSGIGPAKARAIIAYREENGGFSSVEELMKVPGIKEGTFGKIKDNIVVE